MAHAAYVKACLKYLVLLGGRVVIPYACSTHKIDEAVRECSQLCLYPQCAHWEDQAQTLGLHYVCASMQ